MLSTQVEFVNLDVFFNLMKRNVGDVCFSIVGLVTILRYWLLISGISQRYWGWWEIGNCYWGYVSGVKIWTCVILLCKMSAHLMKTLITIFECWTIQWFLQDLTGMLGGVLFTCYQASHSSFIGSLSLNTTFLISFSFAFNFNYIFRLDFSGWLSKLNCIFLLFALV